MTKELIAILDRCEMAEAVADNIPEITKRMKKEGMDHPSSTAWLKS